ncbi:phosphatase PAP2 family protein [Jatrophihabitans endophyticus]|uniref:phosphatase PAP2 family protein n=1 Tax=Jatrophihabitans endophyticus TaxID=1206085 RepID=UPI0019F87AC9|nr:phosphatase PAP2 family protein [Jatrophihabitans endophyticus]MBE7187243.1 phosphatase PAP2 family protein [Jatrophihabitans endophyticus]
MTSDGRPLVVGRWRPIALFAAAVGAAQLVALSFALHDRRTTHFDSRALIWLHDRVRGVAARVALDLSIPAVSLVLLALVLVVALRARQHRLAVLTVLAPAVSSALTEYVFKPLVARPYGTGERYPAVVSRAFPSGHETLVASAAFVVLLAAFRLRPAVRVLAVVLLTAWVMYAGVGLVVNFWHYTTDVFGAIAESAAVVLGGAVAIDRISSPAGRDLPRTSRAA